MINISIDYMRTSGHSALPLYIVKAGGKDKEAFMNWDDVSHFILTSLGEIESSTKIKTIYEKVEE